MSQVLDGRASDLEIGAFAIAMRIKGEHRGAGWLPALGARALHPGCTRRNPAWCCPPYNGARKLPNLTALLALLLAQEGVPVLVRARARPRARDHGRDLSHAGSIAQGQRRHPAAWARASRYSSAPRRCCPPLACACSTVPRDRRQPWPPWLLLAPVQARRSLVVNYTPPEYGLHARRRVLACATLRCHADARHRRASRWPTRARLPRLDILHPGRAHRAVARGAGRRDDRDARAAAPDRRRHHRFAVRAPSRW